MCSIRLPDNTIALAWWRSRRRCIVVPTPRLIRLLRRLEFNTIGLAIWVRVLSVVAVVSLVGSSSVIATLLWLRGVLWRGLLVVVIVVVGLCVAVAGARCPACAVERSLTGLTATASGYTAGRTLAAKREMGRQVRDRDIQRPGVIAAACDIQTLRVVG